MRLKDCHSRRLIDGRTDLFFCAHPRVRAFDNVVTPMICKMCRFAGAQPPESFREIAEELYLQYHSPDFRPPASVAVVIACHNYGRFLGECIQSVLDQLRRADEIVVIDDASTDETGDVAASFQGRGVRYVRIDEKSVVAARRTGLEATNAEVVCFLDADDRLSPDYLQSGLRCFDSSRIGVVYSDVQRFGGDCSRSDYPQFDRDLLQYQNYMHAGSLVLRQALDISNALQDLVPSSFADWYMWRRVIEVGWAARKQPALYEYRRHSHSMLAQNRDTNRRYFQRANLSKAEVTIFTPLSGREALWPRYRQWLEEQSWPRSQTFVYLLDTSRHVDFGRQVRTFLAASDYENFRYQSLRVGRAGLADEPRQRVASEVRLACAKIYNLLAREVRTPWVLIVEDDILPPIGVIEGLLSGFDESTVSVAAPYRGRRHGMYVAYAQAGNDRIASQGRGLVSVSKNGFGCVMLRSDVLREHVFSADGAIPDFDLAFYSRLEKRRQACKLDWNLQCEHVELPERNTP